MKHLIKVFTLSFAFIAGAVAGASATYLYFDHLAKLEQVEAAAGIAHEDQFACVEFYQAGLYQRAGLYRQKFGHWPTNVQALVEAHLLPAVSEVHLCPSQIRLAGGYDNLGSGTVGDFSFIDKYQPKSMANYIYSPYRFRIEGTNFIVICTFDRSHTREAEYEK
jgi:hypothetical protein